MEKKEAYDLLVRSLKIDTVLGNEAELAEMLAEVFEAHDISCELIEYSPGRKQLIATVTGSTEGKSLVLSSHLDVVPIGSEKWAHEPFGAIELDGKLYGRGTSDMKSGLVAMLAAMLNFKQTQQNFNGTIKYVASVGEESNSIGAKQLVEDERLGGIDAMIIGEPTNNNICISHKGALWLRLTTKGKIAHGSMPELGNNAINHLFTVLQALEEVFQTFQANDDLLGEATWSINKIQSGESTNIIPDKAVAEVDIRLIPSQNMEAFKEAIKQKITELMDYNKQLDCEIEFINEKLPIFTPMDNSFVKLIDQTLRHAREEDSEYLGISYYTDASEFLKLNQTFPMVLLGPGNPQLAHVTNEYVEVDKFYEAIDLYYQIMQNYFADN